MTKRLAVYLPDGIYEFLERWAGNERRSVSNLAAVLLEQSVRSRENWELSIQKANKDTPHDHQPT